MHNNEADGETSRFINQMQRVDKDDGKSSGKDIQDASIGIGETLQESNRDDASMDSLDDSKITLPWAFIDCDIDHLVILVAHMLNKLMEHNDQVVLTPSALTRFHSRAPPGISVLDYLNRIVKYTNLEKLPLLSLLGYIDITCTNLPTFTLSSLTVHRFVIAGITAGSKALCDVFCTNVHYSKVGGIRVGELNSLEREFLRVTNWDLCVHAELIQQYYSSLIRSHGGYIQAPPPAKSPFTSFPLEGPVASSSSEEQTDSRDPADGPMAMDIEPEESASKAQIMQSLTGQDENDVTQVLNRVLKSNPTGEERERIIENILKDLDVDDPEDGKRAASTAWSHDTTGLALETLKTLSRSSTTNTILSSSFATRVLLRQAGVLGPSSSSHKPSREAPSPKARPDTKVEREALSVIANTLVHHTKSCLESLKGLNAVHLLMEKLKSSHAQLVERLKLEGQNTSGHGEELDDMLLFLYGRLLFWMTVSKDAGLLDELLHKENLVAVIGFELSRPYVVERKLATEEFLKTTYNILIMTIEMEQHEWEETFGPLLNPLLELFLNIPLESPIPPLTLVINCLTRYPVNPSLLPRWESSTSILPKLLWVVHCHLDRVVPPLPWDFGDKVPSEWPSDKRKELERLDESLAPAMILIASMTGSSVWMKTVVKKVILPKDMDRSPDSTPLEKRKSFLGHILRLIKASSHPHLRTAAGEVLWNLCDKNALELSSEIGYGNAAGLLFQKGMSAPPKPSEQGASIEELSPDEPNDTLNNDPSVRHPITGLEQGPGGQSAVNDMTEEEKEVEAEKMMSIFAKMERNPALSIAKDHPMRDMVSSGRMEEWEREEEERERKRLEEEDDEDEEMALRDLAQYKKRIKRS